MAERQGNRLLVEQTEQFIAENPTVVSINRPVKEADGAGGKRRLAPAVLDPQTVRLVPMAPNVSVERRTSDGEVVTTVYSLVAMPDADIKEEDFFEINDARHEVVTVIGIGGYELRAEMARRG